MAKCIDDKCLLKKPDIGEIIETEYGTEEVVEVMDYDEATEEMETQDREDFDGRVEFFLGDKNNYFEYATKLIKPKPDYKHAKGEIDIHDWSEYPGNFPKKIKK